MERLQAIHGKGEGILQDAVRKVLEELPVVEDFSFAPPEAGGFGKTVVVLRKSHWNIPGEPVVYSGEEERQAGKWCLSIFLNR